MLVLFKIQSFAFHRCPKLFSFSPLNVLFNIHLFVKMELFTHTENLCGGGHIRLTRQDNTYACILFFYVELSDKFVNICCHEGLKRVSNTLVLPAFKVVSKTVLSLPMSDTDDVELNNFEVYLR